MTILALAILALGVLSAATFLWQMLKGRPCEVTLITSLLCTPLGAGLLIGMQLA